MRVKNICRKIMAYVLVAVMILGTVPISAFAEGDMSLDMSGGVITSFAPLDKDRARQTVPFGTYRATHAQMPLGFAVFFAMNCLHHGVHTPLVRLYAPQGESPVNFNAKRQLSK